MGFSHYWYRPPELDAESFKLAVGEVRRILRAAAKKGIRIAGPVGDGNPVAGDDEVVFNGAGGEGYEPFSVPRVSQGRRKEDGTCFEFCKTNHRPYDPVVCAALLVFKQHFGDAFKVVSDGRIDNAAEWGPAIALVRETLGYDVEWEQLEEREIRPKVSHATEG